MVPLPIMAPKCMVSTLLLVLARGGGGGGVSMMYSFR